MTAPQPDEGTQRPDHLRVVGDDERAEPVDITPDMIPPPPRPAAELRYRPFDWFPVVIFTFIGGAGVTGLLSYVIGRWALLVYVVVIVAAIVQFAVTAPGDRHGGGAR